MYRYVVRISTIRNIPRSKSPRGNLLKSIWNKEPTNRPTASEISEVLANNPRIVMPCIDIPLASVQVERTDSLELIPSVRKPSIPVPAAAVNGCSSNGSNGIITRPSSLFDRGGGSHNNSTKRHPPAAATASNGLSVRGGGENASSGDSGVGGVSSSGPYSPMTGVPIAKEANGGDPHREPLLGLSLSAAVDDDDDLELDDEDWDPCLSSSLPCDPPRAPRRPMPSDRLAAVAAAGTGEVKMFDCSRHYSCYIMSIYHWESVSSFS